jgi:hypothetical protein
MLGVFHALSPAAECMVSSACCSLSVWLVASWFTLPTETKSLLHQDCLVFTKFVPVHRKSECMLPPKTKILRHAVIHLLRVAKRALKSTLYM